MALTWLHVSDVHLSASNPHERDVVIPVLFEFVKASRERGNLKPDLIFATGDIAERGSVAAFMGKGSESALATAFFLICFMQQLLKRIVCSLSPVTTMLSKGWEMVLYEHS